MREPGAASPSTSLSHGCACFLSLALASCYVAGAFYNPEAPVLMSSIESIEMWKGEEVRHVASDLVIAVLMVIILVLLALRFF